MRILEQRTLRKDVSIVHATRETDDEVQNSSLVITNKLEIDRVATFPTTKKICESLPLLIDAFQV